MICTRRWHTLENIESGHFITMRTNCITGHKSPILLDAFDGDVVDTVCMILVPLYLTSLTLEYVFQRDVSVWSYMIFGTLYANYLCLIHSEFEHSWDWLVRKLGLCTPRDHHIHHKMFHRNFGHIFSYWDRL